MSSELIKKDEAVLNQGTWATLKEQATMLVKSGFLPTAINTAEKAIAIAMAGRELGVGMMESFRSIYIIQGKPSISPQLMLALAYRTRELENIEIDSTEEKCTVIIRRKGRTPHTTEFGMIDAKPLGLLNKDNYMKQKKTMFQWRALSANLRVTFPDVVLGLYTPEEIGADVRVGDGDTMEVIQEQPKKISGARTQDLVGQIIERLAAHCGGDLKEMDRELYFLTAHNDSAGKPVGLTVADLDKTPEPWLTAILKKMDDLKIGVTPSTGVS